MRSVKVGRALGGLACAVGLLGLLSPAQAQYTEWWFTNIVSANSEAGPAANGGPVGAVEYSGMYVGNDGLPFTADDVDLTSSASYFGAVELKLNGDFGGLNLLSHPWAGNPFGMWGGAIANQSSPSMANLNFDRDLPMPGDQSQEIHMYPIADYTNPLPNGQGGGTAGNQGAQEANGRIWDGRVAEGEFWETFWAVGINSADLNENGAADGTPYPTGPLDNINDGQWDWEINDAPDWCDEANIGWYNNARPNQHGYGAPQYWYSIDNNHPLADEHRGFKLSVTNMTSWRAGDNAGAERRFARTNDNGLEPTGQSAVWWAGYIIPADRLATLTDGELGDPWADGRLPNHRPPTDAGFDLAAYLRDTIAPKLSDGNVFALQDSTNGHIDMSNLELLMVSFINAPLIENTTSGGSDQMMDVLGFNRDLADYAAGIWDVTTETSIQVSGFDHPAKLPQALEFDFKYGTSIQMNTVAWEGFEVVAGPNVDWNGDGELKNGVPAGNNNAWEGEDDVTSEDGSVAALRHVTSDSVAYLGIGGRLKDANGDKCAPGGLPADDRGRVWNLDDGPAYAEAVVRMESNDFANTQVLHITLERDNVPVAWAIIMDGKAPLLGVGHGGTVIEDDVCGDIYGGVDCRKTTCKGNDLANPATLNANAFTCYLLSINDCTKTVKLWMNAGDGANNLLASYDYAASDCAAGSKQVDGMRIYTTQMLNPPVNAALACADVDPTTTDYQLVETLLVDSIAWGYDPFPMPNLQLQAVCRSLIGDPIAPANAEDYVWPVSEQDGNAAGGLTSVDIQLSSDVALIQTGSCVTTQSGGGPTSATIAPLGPVGAYRVTLDAPIPLGEWTTVTIAVQDAESACNQDATICFHLGWQPGDTNGDGQTNLNDATSFGQQFALGINAALKRADLNVDGQVNLNDATRFGNIWNGSSGEQQWLGTGLGAKPGCNCP